MPLYLNGKKVAPVKTQKPTSIDGYTIYSGPYVIDPLTTTDTTLATESKILEQNVIIHKIRFEEVSNLSGGTTAYIGIQLR